MFLYREKVVTFISRCEPRTHKPPTGRDTNKKTSIEDNNNKIYDHCGNAQYLFTVVVTSNGVSAGSSDLIVKYKNTHETYTVFIAKTIYIISN